MSALSLEGDGEVGGVSASTLTMFGLPDKAVAESRERVGAAAGLEPATSLPIQWN